jgi:hypothetical protein
VARTYAHGFSVIAIALFGAGRASAQSNETAAAPRAERAATVLISGSERDIATLEAALADPFRRLGVALRFEHPPQVEASAVLKSPPEASPTVARLWFDLASGSHVPIYVTDAKHERIYSRDFPLARGLDDVAIEQLVYVARSSVDSILAGVDIGVRRDEYEASLQPAPKPTPPPPVERDVDRRPPASPAHGVFWSAGYEAQAMSAKTFSHGPSIGASLARGALALNLSTYYRFPFEARGAELGARISRVGVRLEGSARVGIGGPSSPVSFVAQVGGGPDFSRVTPLRVGAMDATPTGAFWVTDGFARAAAGLAQRFRSGWVLSELAGADMDLALVKYVLDRAGVRETVFVPYRVRPLFCLEVSAPL